MEPVMAQCCFESVDLLINGFDTLRTRCVDGIVANEDRCREEVHHSIGVVTALNPVIGYKNSTKMRRRRWRPVLAFINWYWIMVS